MLYQHWPSRLFLSTILLLLCYNTGFSQNEFTRPRAWFRALVDTNKVTLGESFRLTFSIEVSDNNRGRIQFKDASQQLNPIIQGITELGLIINENLSNIEGVRVEDGHDGKSTRYDVLRVRIQPLKPGKLEIPAFIWRMINIANNAEISNSGTYSKGAFKDINYKSAPVTIQVTDPNKLYSSESSPPIITPLVAKDDISPGPYRLGQLIHYKVTLSGKSIGFMTSLPTMDERLSIYPNHVDYVDTLKQDGTHSFLKVFYLSITPKTTGELDLGDIFKWKYYDKSGKMKSVRVDTKIQVTDEPSDTFLFSPVGISFALDISGTMQINDYESSRLQKGFALIKAYRERFGKAKLIGYAGTVIDLNAVSLTDSVYQYAQTGTAIGNAIWLATESISSEQKIKGLILVGDGALNTGNVSVKRASEFAKSKGVRIYAVGIGRKLTTSNGSIKVQTYEEGAFDDTALKTASEITGGKYYHIDDYPNLEELIRIISDEIKR